MRLIGTSFQSYMGSGERRTSRGVTLCEKMDLSANTFYRRVREYEIQNGIAEQTSA